MGEMAPRLMGPDDWGGMAAAGDAITGGAVVPPAADTVMGFLPSGRALDRGQLGRRQEPLPRRLGPAWSRPHRRPRLNPALRPPGALG